MELDDLEPRSRRFAERLFAAHPEWRSYARRDPGDRARPGTLLLEVPSPVHSRPLIVRTYGDQVTIDFGRHGWHTHFLFGTGASEETTTTEALAFIEDLIAERIVIVTRQVFGRSAWTRAVRTAEVRRPLIGRLEVASWTGHSPNRAE